MECGDRRCHAWADDVNLRLGDVQQNLEGRGGRLLLDARHGDAAARDLGLDAAQRGGRVQQWGTGGVSSSATVGTAVGAAVL